MNIRIPIEGAERASGDRVNVFTSSTGIVRTPTTTFVGD